MRRNNQKREDTMPDTYQVRMKVLQYDQLHKIPMVFEFPFSGDTVCMHPQHPTKVFLWMFSKQASKQIHMVEILETGILHKSIDNTIYKICKMKKSPQQGVRAQRQRQRWGAAEKAIAKTDVGSREGNSTERWGGVREGNCRDMGTTEKGIAERDGDSRKGKLQRDRG